MPTPKRFIKMPPPPAPRARAEQDVSRDEEDERKRISVTTLIVVAHEAATSLEDDLEHLRSRLGPVLDDACSEEGQGARDDDRSEAQAITDLEHLVMRIRKAGAAIRFLTDNARI